jgi:polyhydroxyalkanoate synthesis regulator phasin
MAEVSNELIYEVLKAMQVRLGNIEQVQIEMRTELRAMRGHLNAMQTDIANLYNSVDALEGRVARIEQRLNLADAPQA